MNIRQALEALLTEIERKQIPSPSRDPMAHKNNNQDFFGPFHNWQQQMGASGWNTSVSWPKLAVLAKQAREALRTENLKPEIGGYDPDLDVG